MNSTGCGGSTVGWVMGAPRLDGRDWAVKGLSSWLRGQAVPCGVADRLEGGDEAAVDGEVGSGDVAAAVAGQQQDEVGDLVRPGKAPGDAARRRLRGDVSGAGATGPRQGLSHAMLAEPQPGLHRSGADRVDADADRPDLLGQGLAEVAEGG